MTRLPALARRLAALVLLAGLLAVVWWSVIVPIAERISTVDEAIAYNQQLIERLTSILEGGGALDAQITALTERIDQSGHFIRAETEPLAAARLQEHLKRIATREGGELLSVQSMRSDTEEEIRKIAVRVQMRGEYDSMARILYHLETDEPVLFVENVRIKTASRRRRQKRANDAPDQLSIVFDLFGYLPPMVRQ